MIVFPKLPNLRGRRATYEINGQVSAKVKNPYWRAGDPGEMFEGAKLHIRTTDKTNLELRTLNFIKLHAGAAHGSMELRAIDNNGYGKTLARWTKTVDGWKNGS